MVVQHVKNTNHYIYSKVAPFYTGERGREESERPNLRLAKCLSLLFRNGG